MKKIFILALLIVLPYISTSIANADNSLNRIVAVANGEMITYFDLDRAASPELMRAKLNPKKKADKAKIDDIMLKILDGMILDILIRQEAKKFKIEASEADVDAEIATIIEGQGVDEKKFYADLEKQGISKELMRDRVRNRLVSNRLIGSMVSRTVFAPTKEEVAAYYNEFGALTTGRAAQFSILVYAPNQPVRDWADSIKAGRISFEEAAQRVSIGPERQKGGKLEEMPWEQIDERIRNQIIKLKPKQVSALFKLDQYFAQIKLLKYNPGVTPKNLEEAYPQIEAIVRNNKMNERYKEYGEELRKKARIDIRY